jgi:hypothetical protein
MSRLSPFAASDALRRKYANQWIAIDPSADVSRGPQVVGGVIVDADEELGDLCARLLIANRRHCTIVHASDL